MGLFGTSSDSAVTEEIDNATDENNKQENWETIINICDKAGKSSESAKLYLKTILKRLHCPDPHVAIQAVTLLDACVKNCGKAFHTEVASRDFENEYMKLLEKSHKSVSKKLRECLKRWAETEFKTDTQLNLIPSLYHKLKNSGVDFSTTDTSLKKSATLSKDPNVVESQEEENQILKAIELSLKETKSSPKASYNPSSSLYPSTNLSQTIPAKEPVKVRALYDFEAAEDNELTFQEGEIVFVIDDSDPNWWKGNNHRGEGLFPSNFVTKDLDVEPEKILKEKAKKMVQFKDKTESKVEVAKIEINEEKIDRLLHLLHEADPTNSEADTEEMLKLENDVNNMGPLIDSELERVDRKHAELTKLSADLVEAVSMYHSLMREPPMLSKMPYGYISTPVPPQHPQSQAAALPPPPPTVYNGLPPPHPNMIHHPNMRPPHLQYASLPPMMPGPMGGVLPPPPPGLGGYMVPPGQNDRRLPPNFSPMVPPNFLYQTIQPPPAPHSMIPNGHPQSGPSQFMPTASNFTPKQ